MKTVQNMISIEQARAFSEEEMWLIQEISALPLIPVHEEICTAYLETTDEDKEIYELLQSVMQVRFSIFTPENKSRKSTALITAFGLDENADHIEIRLNQTLLYFVMKK
jgi:hypothetical protein